MATREKALVDLVENRRNVSIRSKKEMRMRFLEDLRMDELTLLELNVERVAHYTSLYGSAKTKLLVNFLMDLNGRHTE